MYGALNEIAIYLFTKLDRPLDVGTITMPQKFLAELLFSVVSTACREVLRKLQINAAFSASWSENNRRSTELLGLHHQS